MHEASVILHASLVRGRALRALLSREHWVIIITGRPTTANAMA